MPNSRYRISINLWHGASIIFARGLSPVSRLAGELPLQQIEKEIRLPKGFDNMDSRVSGHRAFRILRKCPAKARSH